MCCILGDTVILFHSECCCDFRFRELTHELGENLIAPIKKKHYIIKKTSYYNVVSGYDIMWFLVYYDTLHHIACIMWFLGPMGHSLGWKTWGTKGVDESQDGRPDPAGQPCWYGDKMEICHGIFFSLIWYLDLKMMYFCVTTSTPLVC